MIDNYIMDQSPRITMTLSEILANTPPVQTLAQATDVPGTNLEWMKTAAYLTGAWFGDLGELGTTGFRDGLFTGYLALGVTCKVSGVPYSWNGTGWVVQNATPAPTAFVGKRLLNQATGQNSSPGYTWMQSLQGPPGGFSGMYFVFENHDTTRAAQIDLAAVGPVGNKSELGALPTAYNLTFGGSRSGTIPAATAGVGNGNGNKPGILVSDPVSFDSIPRTDGGTIPMIQVRVQTNSTSIAPKYPLGTWESVFSTIPEWEGQFSQLSPEQNTTGSGDWVTGCPAISGFYVPWHNYWLFQFGYPVFFAKGQKLRNLVGFGDSIMIGQGSDRGVTGPLMKAAHITGDCATNFASGGQKYIDTVKLINHYEPTLPRRSVVCMFASSPNDGTSQSALDASYALMVGTYDMLVSKGHIPVVFTNAPWNGNAAIIKVNARLRASGLNCFDLYASLNDPANNGRMAPAYDSGDHLHPNDAGYLQIGTDFAAWITANL